MKYYITTPIYYVNDLPHIGHTYTTVVGDIIARYKRAKGDKVFFLTGTDEHGLKILEAAKKHNKNPKEYCDTVSEEFKSAWKNLNISYDYFIRTTDELHIQTVRKLLQILYEKKSIYKGKYEGLYCIECEKFLLQDELVENKCPIHKTQPKTYSEENYFFDLDQYRNKIIEIISNNQLEILPQERKNEILGKLQLPLPPLSISRAKLEWGIPLPFDETQTTYVWIDALINYLSGVKIFIDDTYFNSYWPADLHLMAKDILWFHAVIWPALLMAVKLPLPKKIFSHGFFTVNEQKISKTLGNVISPQELISIFGTDPTRFLIVSSFPLGQDGDISITNLKERYSSELANNIGNLINRILSMTNKYFNAEIPHSETEQEVLTKLTSFLKLYIEDMEKLKIYEATKTILAVSDFGNKYVDSSSPWRLAKTDKNKLKKVIFNSLTILKTLSVLIYPFMPQVALKIWSWLDEKISIEDQFKKIPEIFPPTGEKIKKYEILFPKTDKLS